MPVSPSISVSLSSVRPYVPSYQFVSRGWFNIAGGLVCCVLFGYIDHEEVIVIAAEGLVY